MTEELKLELTPYNGIATKEGYEKAAEVLHDLGKKRKTIEDFFDPKVDAAFATHKAMLAIKAKFLEPFLDLEKTVKKDMETWREQQKEIERQEKARHEQKLAKIGEQLTTITNEGLKRLRDDLEFDYTKFLSQARATTKELFTLEGVYLDVFEEKILEVLALLGKEKSRLEQDKEDARKKEEERLAGLHFDEPFAEQSAPEPEPERPPVVVEVQAPPPQSFEAQKTKGVATYTDVEVIVIDEKAVPVEFAGKVIRPVDLQAIKQLAKVIGADFKLPGVQVKFVEKIRSTGRF
ncbi:MAG TPA: hypothetical protein PLX04_09075 [Caldisericia bacterium]|nr:hypothetical protein [Caldisericia bacterium]